MLVLYPTVIAPLFNKFSPLADADAQRAHRALLARCGFARQGPVRHGRLAALEPRQRVFHRLRRGEAHRVLRHAARRGCRRTRSRRCSRTSSGTSSCATSSSASLWFARRQPRAPRAARRGSIGRSRGSTPASACRRTPPAHGRRAGAVHARAAGVHVPRSRRSASLYSRRHEFEADAYAAEHASRARSSRALVKLYEDNAATLTPDPLHSAFYDSHPPAAARIARLEASSA